MKNKKYLKILIVILLAFNTCTLFACTDLIEWAYLKYGNNAVFNNYDVFLNRENYLYRIVNNNVPDFDLKKYDGKAFENYSELDELGRCGPAEALIGEEIMPKQSEKRGSIGMVKPSGWPTPPKKYETVEGKYLYNRCHLIGWQLSAENANKKNLITGTSWLNRKAMLPYEQQVANYIRATHNHVLYRVTPIFEGDNLVASRIQIEALSYEDKGVGIKMNILLENYQPGIHIDYATGDSYEEKNVSSK